jgi:hypothetical protein
MLFVYHCRYRVKTAHPRDAVGEIEDVVADQDRATASTG